jgi:parallel beta-helix repeat protein
MMNLKNKIFAILILIPISILMYISILYFARREKSTQAQYPLTYTDSNSYCEGKPKLLLEFSPQQTVELQTALNSLKECTTINLKSGIFLLNNSLTINNVNGIILQGAGKKSTILKFVNAGNGNGIDVEASNSFTIRNLTILDSPKNGLEIRLSENILIENIIVTWSNTSGEAMSQNGAYGVYPVNVINVLLQNTETYYASDAGLYVGQCINALVRNNTAAYNVMGLEIENTVNADVYGNTVRDNTGGFLAYDLNKNTIVSRNIRVHNNTIINNNNPNFSSAGIVKTVPAGVGVVLTSIRDIEIFNNRIGNNHTTDIGIINGLVSESPDFSAWSMNNWRAHSIYIHDNEFVSGSGVSIDNGNTNAKDRPLGALVQMVHSAYNSHMKSAGKPEEPLANILYDGVDTGFTILMMTTWFGDQSGNFNSICLQNNNKGKVIPSLLDLNLPSLLNNSEEPTQESIAESIKSKKTRIYRFSDIPSYGGQPPEGFDCKGYIASDLPVSFPEK